MSEEYAITDDGFKANYATPELGDCDRTCVAYIMRRERDSVPHFFEGAEDVNIGIDGTTPNHKMLNQMYAEKERWLNEQGYFTFVSNIVADFPTDAMELFAWSCPWMEYILIGKSNTESGFNHSVVCKGSQMIFDPNGPINEKNPIFSGPAEPDDNWNFTMLIPSAWSQKQLIYNRRKI